MCGVDGLQEFNLGTLKTYSDELKYEADCHRDKCGVVSNGDTKIQAW